MTKMHVPYSTCNYAIICRRQINLRKLSWKTCTCDLTKKNKNYKRNYLFLSGKGNELSARRKKLHHFNIHDHSCELQARRQLSNIYFLPLWIKTPLFLMWWFLYTQFNNPILRKRCLFFTNMVFNGKLVGLLFLMGGG